jgi:cell division protein FtsL
MEKAMNKLDDVQRGERVFAITMLVFLIVVVLLTLFSCNKETYCWQCVIKERYIDSNGTIINWYKDCFEICDLTEEDVFYFERRNTVIVDSARMIGTTIECQIK